VEGLLISYRKNNRATLKMSLIYKILSLMAVSHIFSALYNFLNNIIMKHKKYI